MPLEATMLCLDNSEWNRNGDFAPSRFDAQQDAANIICTAKTQQNPESTCGILSMAGKRVEMRLTQTNDGDELANAINNIQINGAADLLTAIKIAQLSLKHRKNKSQRQRIIVFVGHPMEGTEEDFEDVGMRLKKNNVSVDIINFSNPDNVSRLQTLVNTANKESDDLPTCHFLDVPEGITSITDVMISSPILMPEDMGQGGDAGGAGAGAGGMGIDANMDPELAEAIRLSMMDAEAAQAQAQPAVEANQQAQVPATTSAQQANVQPGLGGADDDDAGMYDDDGQDDDEKAFQEALALSMKPDPTADAKPEGTVAQPKKVEEPVPQVDIDADFMKDVIGDLGINIDDDQVKDILNEAKKPDDKKDEKDDDKKDKK